MRIANGLRSSVVACESGVTYPASKPTGHPFAGKWVWPSPLASSLMKMGVRG